MKGRAQPYRRDIIGAAEEETEAAKSFYLNTCQQTKEIALNDLIAELFRIKKL